jgi:hypothetical protein
MRLRALFLFIILSSAVTGGAAEKRFDYSIADRLQPAHTMSMTTVIGPSEFTVMLAQRDGPRFVYRASRKDCDQDEEFTLSRGDDVSDVQIESAHALCGGKRKTVIAGRFDGDLAKFVGEIVAGLAPLNDYLREVCNRASATFPGSCEPSWESDRFRIRRTTSDCTSDVPCSNP